MPRTNTCFVYRGSPDITVSIRAVVNLQFAVNIWDSPVEQIFCWIFHLALILSFWSNTKSWVIFLHSCRILLETFSICLIWDFVKLLRISSRSHNTQRTFHLWGNKNCPKELKLCEISRNSESKGCWKFQLFQLDKQKSFIPEKRYEVYQVSSFFQINRWPLYVLTLLIHSFGKT